jgi:methylase of polypeptide subunit release factors
MKKAVLNKVKLDSLTTTSLRRTKLEPCSPEDIFFCPEESQFYSQCLENMVFNRHPTCKQVIEFGTGDGSPVISSLLKTRFDGVVHGFELSATACEIAQSRIAHYQLEEQYKIRNHCFFEGYRAIASDCLIANPPYIPAPDNRIYLPTLHGGIDGATLTNQLLSLGCETVMLMISAYSNPVATIQQAIGQGYSVTNFMITPLEFGYYSSEPRVRDWITQLREQNKAFYSANVYFLAGVLFQRKSAHLTDLSSELIKVITVL